MVNICILVNQYMRSFGKVMRWNNKSALAKGYTCYHINWPRENRSLGFAPRTALACGEFCHLLAD